MPLIHAATAVVVALVARRLYGGRIGGLAGFAFVSLPGVALSSLLVSTDTPMLFCFALGAPRPAPPRRAPLARLGARARGGGGGRAPRQVRDDLLPARRGAGRAGRAVGADRLARRRGRRRRRAGAHRAEPRLERRERLRDRAAHRLERRLAGTAARPRGARRVPRRAVRHVGAGLLRRLPRCGRPARGRSDAALPGADVAAGLRDRLGPGADLRGQRQLGGRRASRGAGAGGRGAGGSPALARDRARHQPRA